MRRSRRHTTRAEWLDLGFLFAMIGTGTLSEIQCRAGLRLDGHAVFVRRSLPTVCLGG
jgi:hypothetical protein